MNTTTPIQFGQPTSITVPANNSTDTDRQFDITANVTIKNGTVTDISEGRVQRHDATEAHLASAVADFQKQTSYENLTIHGTITAEERAAIREAVDAFTAAVEAADLSINN